MISHYYINHHFSDEMYDFEMKSDEEDEDAIIEKRRKQRQAIVNKYTGITSQPVSIATPASSQDSDSSSSSSSSDESDSDEGDDTKDIQKELVSYKTKINLNGKEDQDAKKKQETETNESSKNGDMFAADDMFSENYSVSIA